jgi:hypothetical protein
MRRIVVKKTVRAVMMRTMREDLSLKCDSYKGLLEVNVPNMGS